MDEIHTRKDFVAFLRGLLSELQTERQDWENDTLESYLEAMAAWVQDAEGYYSNQGLPTPESLDWNAMAEIFLAARYYE